MLQMFEMLRSILWQMCHPIQYPKSMLRQTRLCSHVGFRQRVAYLAGLRQALGQSSRAIEEEIGYCPASRGEPSSGRARIIAQDGNRILWVGDPTKLVESKRLRRPRKKQGTSRTCMPSTCKYSLIPKAMDPKPTRNRAHGQELLIVVDDFLVGCD